MSSSLILTHAVYAAHFAAESAGEHGGPPIPAWAVGAIALGILLSLMMMLIVFGGGREHS